MDVRQFAFLARQPSAVLMERERFWGMPKRGLALILINAMFWQPLMAQADGIAVSGGTQTSLNQAGNGVPIVNIAAPNASGLSHNQYQQYNVDAQGVILNNATARTQNTQLGGIIVGNPNFTGTAASTILNEVVGANASQLKGYTEVAGQSARVIVANPYGISCNGCGFINTPRVTLTTGKPVLDNGQLQRFQVDGGSISIDGSGVNADNVDQFELITRAAQINAQINAKQLTIVAGRNDVDAQTLSATARADDGSSKPVLAIDSSALGGMYAGAIKLVGTEAGVGVRLAGNLAASAGDIQIDANGQLNMTQVSAAGAVNVKAVSLDAAGPVYAGTSLSVNTTGDVINRQSIAARDGVVLSSGGQLTNPGIIEAGVNADNSRNVSGDVSITAQNVRNTGSITASRALTANVSQTLNNQGGTLNSQARTQVTAGTLDNRQSGRVLSQGSMGVTADQLLNTQNGLVSSAGDLSVNAGYLDNSQQGKISTSSALTVHVTGQLLNALGILGANGNLVLSAGALDNRNGEISTLSDLSASGGQADNSGNGRILANGDLSLTFDGLNNQNKGAVSGQRDVNINVGQLSNTGVGSVYAKRNLNLSAANDLNNNQGVLRSDDTLSLRVGSLANTGGSVTSAGVSTLTGTGAIVNHGGEILSDTKLTLTSASLDNSQKGRIAGKGVVLNTGAFDNHQNGSLTSTDTLQLTAAQVNNSEAGRIASAMALNASVTGLDQLGGQMFSKTALTLDMNNGQLNNQGGLINAPGTLLLKNLNGVNNQNGEISSAQAFTLTAQNLDNSGGKLISNQSLTMRIAQVLSNINGTVSAQGLDITSASLDNTEGMFSSHAGLKLTVDNALNNHQGTLIADEDFLLNAASADNSLGQISSKKNLTAKIGNLQQQGGQLIALGMLNLTGNRLDNRLNGLIGATQALTLNVDDIDNRGGEVSSQDTITVNGQQLNNSDSGKVLAQQALRLNVAKITNLNNGLLSGKAGITLVGDTLDNTGGSLVGLKGIDINFAGLLDNSQGLISSEDMLNARVGSLINNAGSVSSAGLLTLNSVGSITNHGGKLVTDGALTLHSDSLDNSAKGSISSKGALAIITGNFDNSQAGLVSTSDRLDLTAAQLTNRDGGSIGSTLDLVASISGLDQQNGKLFSSADLTLDLNNGQLNNQGGLINTPGALLLKNFNGVNNQNGEISSNQAFTLAAQSLDNSGGKLLSNQDLNVRIAHALINIKGMIAAASLDVQAGTLDNGGGTITSRSDLQLSTNGLLSNRDDGLISAAQALNVRSTNLDNQGGQLLANSVLTVNAAALNNTANGLINSQDSLNITADSLDSSNGGEVSAHGDMSLTLNALTQNGGRLLGDAALTLDLNGADLNNRAGLITAKGPLTLNRLRDINNQGGEISSSQSFTLAGGNFDNTNGKLISNNLLTVNTASVINQNGLISGWQGLSVNSGVLDNRNNGTLSSRNGSVAATVSGALLNSSGGALVSQNALTVNAASLDNRGGILSSGGAQTLTVNGLLDNSQNGLIDSGAALTVNATTLSNAAGNITAQQDVSFTGNALDNSAGNLSSKGAVTLDLLGALTNSNGKLASAGALLLRRSSQIVNQGGQLVSQSLMTLNTASLDNRNRGTVAANSSLVINSSAAVLNSADGLIYSQIADVQLQAGSLSNGNGALQSQGAMNLNVAGDIDNQTGRIIAQGGDLGLSASNLYNQGGVLSSLQGAFTARVTGVLKNGYNANRQGGVIQAQRLDLRALGGFDNYGGRVSARGGDALITTGNFDNRNGGLYATGRVGVTGNNFDNSGDNDGQIAANQIDLNLSGALNNRLGIIESDSTLSVTAGSVDNQTGKLRALGGAGTTQFNIGGTFDNRNGVLESANNDLNFNVSSFLNANGSLLHVGNGEFAISTANVTNAGGSIVTRGGLTLNADSWTNSSVIQAGRLNVNVNNFNQTASGQLLASSAFVGTGGNWNNDGLIASDGSLNLNIGGTYSGNGRMSSLGNLSASAGQMTLGSATTIAGGGSTAINAGGQLTNYGRLTSAGDMTVNAGGVNNYGTLGAAQDLTVVTQTLLNNQAADGSRGFLFSGRNMKLQVGSFTNQYADVYSLGSLLVTGVSPGSSAQNLLNSSASIEAAGDITVAADSFVNQREKFAMDQQVTGGYMTIRCVQHCDGPSSPRVRGPVFIYQTVESTVSEDSPMATFVSGHNLSINSQNFLNQYSLVSAANDLSITSTNITNKAALSASGTSGHEVGANNWVSGSDFYQLINDVQAYDAQHPRTGPFDIAAFNELVGKFDPVLFYGITDPVTVKADGQSVAAAIIQAGGAVNLNASNDISNLVVQKTTTAVTNRSSSTGVYSATQPSVVLLNRQLPPNLAQQQVNPLSLPGFSLPTGQNGLFRLSGQAGNNTQSTQASATPQSWTIGGASVSVAQREQTVSDTQARNIQIDSAGQISASAGQLTTTTRQTTGQVISAPGITRATTATAQKVNKVQGLPSYAARPNGNKYLIETNPVLTDLKQFMSSDYLLSGLGYDPDTSAKRLGDGFYEQRLVQQAVTARTGQAFIDGQTSNEAQFKYLMSNAIASKDALNLSVGVGLTAQQVAALTHDIVWMEDAVVNGETVLVPVLYLANANNRLASNGALIAGKDVTLIAGENLDNVGTLRATNNLSATAGNDLVNSGLIEAGNRLDLLAGNDIVNKAGGIISGRDVTLTAINGDVINERTVTSMDSSVLGQRHNDYADNAARIEAANDLSISAGRDINNIGSDLQSRRDMTLSAGRDVNLVATQVTNSLVRDSKHTSSDITQTGSTVTAGRDISAQAGRDINAIASSIDATRDIAMAATENINISSAADEEHSLSKSKKLTVQEDHVSQVATEIKAGGSVAISAGQNLAVTSSRITAGYEAYLVAGDKLEILAAQDSDYSLYDKKSKGSFGAKKTKRDEVTKVTNIGSEITSGGNMVLVSGGDQRYQVAKLNSGKDLTISSGGAITFEGVKDLNQESHEKSNTSLAWNSMSGKGNTDETLRQSELIAKGNLAINAVDGLHIDVKQVNQHRQSGN
ncbi:two-partner secretion domain-containing protein [Pseudomonas huanghezhanensis]|uniref:two-partner secretion domain-containing protein n=1 Tax=Pseudomonas huanghezhanensis TaxID=3002903 RepID=UPI0038B42503